MTPHANDMSAWGSIACQRGPDHEHHTRTVHVDLSKPHGYRDLAQVPEHLAVEFDMVIWDPEKHPVDGGPYCPAHDAVSETIVSHGIWEPRETILALQVLSTAKPGQHFIDCGAQLGWFSLLATALDVTAYAIEADWDNVNALTQSTLANLDGERTPGPMTKTTRIVRGMQPLREWDYFSVAGTDPAIRLAKIDVEGAEAAAVGLLRPSIEAANVDHLLIEVSPVFHPGDHYPDLVCDLIDAGYECYRLPDKRVPPFTLDDPEHDMAPWRIDTMEREKLRAGIAALHQDDFWFHRIGAEW